MAQSVAISLSVLLIPAVPATSRRWAGSWSCIAITSDCWPAHLIGRRSRSQLDASDLVQETFLKAHREFAQFRRLRRAGAGRLAPPDPGSDPRPTRPSIS